MCDLNSILKNKEQKAKWDTAVPFAKERAIEAERKNAASESVDVPKIGTPLYMYRDCSLWTVRMVHNPYTVVGISPSKKNVYVQEAKLIFNGPQYYDSLPDRIEENPAGKIKKLRYDKRNRRWVVTPKDYDAEVAVFGEYDYSPYLD